MADRSPFCDTTITAAPLPDLMIWDTASAKPTSASIKNNNAAPHQRDGQNVLYADYHVKFEKSANCSVELDNIYTVWDDSLSVEQEQKQIGELPRNPDFVNSVADTDSYLVNDPVK